MNKNGNLPPKDAKVAEGLTDFQSSQNPRSSKLGEVGWKSEVNSHFAQFELSESKISQLQSILLDENANVFQNTESFALKSSLSKAQVVPSKLQNILISTLKYVAACAASLVVFVNTPVGVREWFSESFDFVQTESSEVAAIEELASQPSPKVFPADFDLEGDASSFQDIMASLNGSKETFSAEIPADIRQKWSPKEGRMFTWAGAAGVSIELASHSKVGSVGSGPAVLYIVSLSESSGKKFPKNKLNKEISRKQGKSQKVNVWREGKYGYAFVETVALGE